MKNNFWLVVFLLLLTALGATCWWLSPIAAVGAIIGAGLVVSFLGTLRDFVREG